MARSIAEAKVTIVNKSSSVATVTYTNWTESTSRSIVIPAGSKLVTYNWHGPDDTGTEVIASENLLGLPMEVYNPVNPPLINCLIQDFGYDKQRVSITLTYDPQF